MEGIFAIVILLLIIGCFIWAVIYDLPVSCEEYIKKHPNEFEDKD